MDFSGIPLAKVEVSGLTMVVSAARSWTDCLFVLPSLSRSFSFYVFSFHLSLLSVSIPVCRFVYVSVSVSLSVAPLVFHFALSRNTFNYPTYLCALQCLPPSPRPSSPSPPPHPRPPPAPSFPPPPAPSPHPTLPLLEKPLNSKQETVSNWILEASQSQLWPSELR